MGTYVSYAIQVTHTACIMAQIHDSHHYKHDPTEETFRVKCRGVKRCNVGSCCCESSRTNSKQSGLTTYKVPDGVVVQPFTFQKDSVLHHCTWSAKHSAHHAQEEIAKAFLGLGRAAGANLALFEVINGFCSVRFELITK